MALRRLRVSSLRCIEHAELSLHSTRNVLFGPNGAGKTSLLEAVFLLGRGRSFRTRQIRKLVRTGSPGFAVFGEADARDGARRLGVAFTAGRLEKKLDGEAAEITQLAAALPVHVIDPGLHGLIEGPPTERRRFLDWGVFHVEPRYLIAWRAYRRVLGQRNAALKTANAAELAGWTQLLAEAGRTIHEMRAAYVATLAPAVADAGSALLGGPVIAEYRPGWPVDGTLEQALRETELRDRATGVTQAGPHRADLRILLDARGVRDEASRGQQKLVAAALVLGQVRAHHAATKTKAVVLADDPAAELDAPSLGRLLAALDALPAQLLIAALAPAQLAVTPDSAVFHVERGKVQAV